MKKINKDEVMNLVNEICSMENSSCRGLDVSDLARKLMDIASVPQSANIQEIPLCWNKEVVILFLMPGDTNYYSLFAGIGMDGNFYFQLTITGILKKDGWFNFYDEEKILSLEYFENYRAISVMAKNDSKKVVHSNFSVFQDRCFIYDFSDSNTEFEIDILDDS